MTFPLGVLRQNFFFVLVALAKYACLIKLKGKMKDIQVLVRLLILVFSILLRK